MGRHNGNQARVWALLDEGLSEYKIAEQLGISRSTVRVHKKARAKAYIGQKSVPDGVTVTNGTMHIARGEDGKMEVIQAWPRVKPDEEKWQDFVDTLIERVPQSPPIPKTRKAKDKDRLLLIPLPDLHIGERLWKMQTGKNWDVKIALAAYSSAVRDLIDSSPKCHTIMFKCLGDLTHADDDANETPASKHKLSVDGRHLLTIARVRDWFYDLVDYAARQAKRVEVRFVAGNHDPKTTPLFAMIMEAYYARVDQVSVTVPYTTHQFHRFGATGWMDTHGHKGKLDKMGRGVGKSWYGIFANTKVWKQTRFHEIHFGHFHAQSKYALAGCVAECFETPMPEGEHAVDECYLSDRHSIHAIVYDRHEGQVDRRRKLVVAK